LTNAHVHEIGTHNKALKTKSHRHNVCLLLPTWRIKPDDDNNIKSIITFTHTYIL